MSRPYQKFLLGALALSQTAHATEHIIIIDHNHPSPPAVTDVLQRIGLHQNHANITSIYNNSAFSGFAATIRPRHVAHISQMSDILLVEKSISVTHTGLLRRDTVDQRPNATWGLERISNAFFQGTDTQNMDYTYTFDGSNPGQGADIYIIDSGVWAGHNGFEGRAQTIWSFDGNYTDTDGHGTHVAGTAAAVDFGVASTANVFGIRVLDDKGRGSTATVIAGIDYVINQHDQRTQNGSSLGSVINISLAAQGKVSALDQAISAAVSAGIHTVVAAGNEDVDACTGSPASSGGNNGSAVTVGSIGISGQHSTFSNYGNCVDVYAPGEDVLSAGMHNPDLLVFLSGTSQATPHVTGLVAYAMSNQTLARDPALMKQWVRDTALPVGDGTFIASNGASIDVSQGMLGLEKATAPIHASNFIASQAGIRGASPEKRHVQMLRKWLSSSKDSCSSCT